ncbi:hypothetical protein GRZ55_11205 [Chelativorans sp. ZYF759]|uniref:hypothetical protein n=1 Tax=Chelativorans sp. ZYF759 TaxID=2692213 RepID=UPI00145EE49E|nr:hypothetical protein [Chelativorans sp. ZYF759]NMG39811.1 hypothetical protein [Chelativorans sp. ZYF759]
MSLVRIGLRIAAVEALKGQTRVLDNVLDSQIAALDIGADGAVRTDEEKPFIAVYTSGAVHEGSNDLRMMLDNGLTEIEFEMGISAAMTETNDNTGESFIVEGMPATDPAYEFHLDMVAREIADTLNDPANEWAEIYRGLVMSYVKIEHARTSSGHIGVKLAGRQIRVTAQLIEDPAKGTVLPPEAPLARLIAKLAVHANPVRQVQGAILASAISGSDEPWDAVRRHLGMTADELAALGLSPLVGDDGEPAPEGTLATLDIEGRAGIEVENG